MTDISKLNVLVVEDEPLLQRALCGKLEGLGASIVGRTASKQKGLEPARTVDLDIAFLDVFSIANTAFPSLTGSIGAGSPTSSSLVTCFKSISMATSSMSRWKSLFGTPIFNRPSTRVRIRASKPAPKQRSAIDRLLGWVE